MIAGRAILKVNNSEYDILKFNHKFQRDIDAKGRPCSNYYGGEISVMLETTDNIQLLQQMIHKDMPTIDGSIEVLSGSDENCIKRIEFKEAYIYSYGEDMQSTGGLPMATTVMISPMRLDYNNNILRLDRKWPRAKHGWQKYEEEVKYVKSESQAPPTPLVTAIKGESNALPYEEVKYTVTGYNHSVTPDDKKRIKWVVEINGKRELQKEQGETLTLPMNKDWEGKEIVVMPYLQTCTPKVSVKTKVETKGAILFVNGYWNSGDTAEKVVSKASTKAGKEMKNIIAENMGDTPKKGYWGSRFTDRSISYFTQKYKNWCGKTIKDIEPIFIDGANIWSSSGTTRYQSGWNEASDILFEKELKNKKVINEKGEQMKRIFIVSHSMGGAHAEGIIAHLLSKGLIVEWVLHFAPADNAEFRINLPRATYQINIMPDPVLAYKNFNDVVKTDAKNLWDNIKETIGQKTKTGVPKPHPYQISNLLPDHFIIYENGVDMLNHYYSKSEHVWEMVEFLKQK